MGPSTIHVLHLASATGAAARDVDRIFRTCQGLENHGGTREFRGSVAIIRPGRARGAYAEAAQAQGVDCYEARRFGPCDPSLWFRLGNLIQRLSIDIVHTYDRESRFWALVLQPRFRFRTVAKAFEPEATTWTERLSREIDHKLLPGFDRVIAANAQLARQLCQLGCRMQQIDVIPEGAEEVAAEFRVRAAEVLRRQLVIPNDAKMAALYLDGASVEEVRRLAEEIRAAADQHNGLFALGVGPDIARTEIRTALLDSGLSPRLRMYDVGDRLIGLCQAVDVVVCAGNAAAMAALEAQSTRTPSLRFSPQQTGIGELAGTLLQTIRSARFSVIAPSPALDTASSAAEEDPTDQLLHSYRKAMLV